jgi:hypothetical protein
MHAVMYSILATVQPAVEVDIGEKGGGAWYSNPLWVGVGVIVLLLVVLIAVTAARKT